MPRSLSWVQKLNLCTCFTGGGGGAAAAATWSPKNLDSGEVSCGPSRLLLCPF